MASEGASQLRPGAPLPAWLSEMLPYRRYTLPVNDYRMHFVDQGDGPVVLLLHGNPTWCFLWRKVIERLLPGGVRVIAPDLLGLGLSDHPRRVHTHSLDFHAANLLELVETLELDGITLVGQDWGGPIGAVMAARAPQRIHGAVFANTAIAQPTGKIRTTFFHRLSHFPLVSDALFRGFNFPVPVLHKIQGDPASIGWPQRRAYWYPLRRGQGRTAPLALARMVPGRISHPTVATLGESDRWAREFQGPVELIWGNSDPILGPALKPMRRLFPQARVTETGAGHFLQEEVPDELARVILHVVQGTSPEGNDTETIST